MGAPAALSTHPVSVSYALDADDANTDANCEFQIYDSTDTIAERVAETGGCNKLP